MPLAIGCAASPAASSSQSVVPCGRLAGNERQTAVWRELRRLVEGDAIRLFEQAPDHAGFQVDAAKRRAGDRVVRFCGRHGERPAAVSVEPGRDTAALDLG